MTDFVRVAASLMIFALFALVASPAFSKDTLLSSKSTLDTTKADAYFFSLEERKSFYKKRRRSMGYTMASNLLLPGLGNLYVDQTFAGVGCAAVFVMSASMVIIGANLQSDAFIWLGAGLVVASYTTSIITTHFGVIDYNEKLRRTYGLTLQDVEELGSLHKPGVTLTLRF